MVIYHQQQLKISYFHVYLICSQCYSSRTYSVLLLGFQIDFYHLSTPNAYSQCALCSPGINNTILITNKWCTTADLSTYPMGCVYNIYMYNISHLINPLCIINVPINVMNNLSEIYIHRCFINASVHQYTSMKYVICIILIIIIHVYIQLGDRQNLGVPSFRKI